MKDNNKKKNVYDYVDKAGNVIKKITPYALGVGALIIAIFTGKNGDNKA